MKEKNKGITLIALVITIIILLILAGISIASLTGSGLFEKSKEAKEKSKNAQELENSILSEYENQIEILGGNSTSNESNKVTNPIGAMPSGATVIESDASKGIVIKDSNDNEWTWVEVPKTIEVFKTALASNQYTEIANDLKEYAKEYRATGWDDVWYDGCGLTPEKYTETYNKMLSSIFTNGGFWISRYEIGNVSDTPVSKPGQSPYTYVICSTAQQKASTMSIDPNKTASLLFGIQWDLVCKYLEVEGDWDTTTNLASYYLKIDSSTWGNYYGGRNPPGSDATKKMNIYDFAGNKWELTLEKTSGGASPWAMRGGFNAADGSWAPASSRACATEFYSGNFQMSTYIGNVSFRVTLF